MPGVCEGCCGDPRENDLIERMENNIILLFEDWDIKYNNIPDEW